MGPSRAAGERASAILTVDLEDWNQLASRQSGHADWDVARAPFPRQVEELLGLLEEVGARATFFVLGVTAHRYPGPLRALAARGHAIASHGHRHHPVWQQSARAFRDDLQRSIDEIGAATGARPVGYRAPAFSIRRADVWAFEVLADLGFVYDSSQHDSPHLPDRCVPARPGPHPTTLPSGRTLVEFPPAVLRWGPWRVPFGGGSYWRVLPDRLIRGAIASHLGRGDSPTLYFHPYEFDPEPLRIDDARPGDRWSELRYNFRRRSMARRLRALARRFSFIACEDYLEQHPGTGPTSLS